MNKCLEEVRQLVECYEKSLVKYAHSILHNLEHSRDVVQEAFIKFLEKRRTGDEIMNPKSWIYKVVYNKSIDIIRKNKRHTELQEDVKNTMTPHRASRPDEALLNKDNVAWLKNQLETLGQKELEIFRMKIYEEKSYKEIADELDLTIGYVGVVLHRVMKKLEKGKDELTAGGSK